METTIETLASQLRDSLSEMYRKFGNNPALTLGSGKAYTGFEVANAIAKENNLGIEMMEHILKLSVEMLKTDREGNNDAGKAGLFWLVGHLEQQEQRFSIKTAEQREKRELLRDFTAMYFDGMKDMASETLRVVKTLINGEKSQR